MSGWLTTLLCSAASATLLACWLLEGSVSQGLPLLVRVAGDAASSVATVSQHESCTPASHPCSNETSFWRPRMLMGATLGVQAVVLGQVGARCGRPAEQMDCAHVSQCATAGSWDMCLGVFVPALAHPLHHPASSAPGAGRHASSYPAGASPSDRHQDAAGAPRGGWRAGRGGAHGDVLRMGLQNGAHHTPLGVARARRRTGRCGVFTRRVHWCSSCLTCLMQRAACAQQGPAAGRHAGPELKLFRLSCCLSMCSLPTGGQAVGHHATAAQQRLGIGLAAFTRQPPQGELAAGALVRRGSRAHWLGRAFGRRSFQTTSVQPVGAQQWHTCIHPTA